MYYCIYDDILSLRVCKCPFLEAKFRELVELKIKAFGTVLFSDIVRLSVNAPSCFVSLFKDS